MNGWMREGEKEKAIWDEEEKEEEEKFSVLLFTSFLFSFVFISIPYQQQKREGGLPHSENNLAQ